MRVKLVNGYDRTRTLHFIMSSMLDKDFKNNLNSNIVLQQSKMIFKKLNRYLKIFYISINVILLIIY